MKFKRLLAVIGAMAIMTCSTGVCVSATSGFDLNNIGAETSANYTEGSENGGVNLPGGDTYSETNEAVMSNIDNGVSITSEDMEKASKLAAPIVNTIRWVIAILLVLFPALLILNTMIDLLCILISPFRRAVEAVNGGAGASGMGGMPGMGGIGGMGGMGMGGMPGAAAPADDGSIFTMVAKWASAEASAAILASKPAGAGAGGMGMMGMGGYGQPASAAKPKSVLVQYFKKRTVALVVAGVCIICFACTAFTDLGLSLGSWIVDRVSGITV